MTKNQQLKKIIDAHMKAIESGTFDDLTVKNREELITALKAGYTFKALIEEIEIRYCSITSIITARHFKHLSEAYKRAIRKGFKIGILPSL